MPRKPNKRAGRAQVHSSYGPSRGQKQTKNARQSPLNGAGKPFQRKSTKKTPKGDIRRLRTQFDMVIQHHKRNMTNQQFQREFYSPSPRSLAISDEKILEWKKEHDVTIVSGVHGNISKADKKPGRKIKDANLPKPILQFDHIKWPNVESIARKLKKSFRTPTPIQSATWPLLMSGRNVIGIAKTGSGKTLAFLLPAIVHMRAQPKSQYPKVLIVLPTRELAVQVEAEIEKFASDVKHVCVYGGASQTNQLTKVNGKVEILVATPGRLLDFLGRKLVNLGMVTFAIFDEADRLLDMGFAPDLDRIMKCVRSDKQMLMYSATWPQSVRELAIKHLGNTEKVVTVSIGSMDKMKANENITQKFQFFSSDQEKDPFLFGFLLDNLKKKILVFCDRKRRCKDWANFCNERSLHAEALCGGKNQNARERALDAFKSGRSKVMFATDVAARGLHINDIDIVINYFMPHPKCEEYIHRIGRTARAGKKGLAISYFVAQWDSWCAKEMIQIIRKSGQPVPQELVKMKNTRKSRKHGWADCTPKITKADLASLR